MAHPVEAEVAGVLAASGAAPPAGPPVAFAAAVAGPLDEASDAIPTVRAVRLVGPPAAPRSLAQRPHAPAGHRPEARRPDEPAGLGSLAGAVSRWLQSF
jgi:hypothetical protein